MGYTVAKGASDMMLNDDNFASIVATVVEECNKKVEDSSRIVISKFMNGKKQLIDRLIQTKKNLFQTINNGTALMQ